MKKGFTLVELLAVIAIIALITTLVLSNILKKSNEMKTISDNKVKELIVSSAKSYVAEHKNEKLKLKSGETLRIPYTKLRDLDYLPSTLISVKTYKQVNINNYSVCVRYSNYKYIYTITTESTCGS